MIEFAVLAPLVPMTVGEQYVQGSIPLHVTVLPKVRVSQDRSEAFVSEIRDEVTITFGPIVAVAGGYAYFGRASEVHVTTVEDSTDLRLLHCRLLECALRAGGVSAMPSYSGAGYRPHISHIEDGGVRPGERVAITTLAILDCTQAIRTVCATASLTGAR